MSAPATTPTLSRSDKVMLGLCVALVILAGFAEYGGWDAVVAFVVSAGAVCLLAALVGAVVIARRD